MPDNRQTTRRSDRKVERLLALAAELWLEAHPRPIPYSTTQNEFLGKAERAYFRASK